MGTGQPFSVEAQRYIEEDLEEMKLRQDNQDRKIEALSEQIDDQNKIIRQLVGIVKEVVVESMLHKLNNFDSRWERR